MKKSLVKKDFLAVAITLVFIFPSATMFINKNEQPPLRPLSGLGYIAAWGLNDYGQCNVPSPNNNFIDIARGCSHHSLGLKANGSIVAWGYNGAGQCNVPSPNNNFIGIAGGGSHSLGLKANGSIVAWGYNGAGQCNVPSPNNNFIGIAGGGLYSLGLKANGSIVAWGYNGAGQCNVPSPNNNFIGIAGGGLYSLGLKANGSIVAWGGNNCGQCNVPSPNSGFMAIAAGGWHSLGLKLNGSIVAWGRNNCGQCNVPSPNSGFTAIAAGVWHSMVLKLNGSIVAWGDNGQGQCNVPSPNSGFTAIAVGDFHSLGLKSNQPPVFGAPSPTNGSTGNSLSFNWSIPINDPEGDQFSWTIHSSNGQNNSGTGSTNGTKSLIISGLAYSTIYRVWVNATDPTGSGLSTMRWYTFTTKANQPPNPPTISGPHYGKINTDYTFSLGAITDPGGDQLYCHWDWGDGNMSGWLGPFNSGETISALHAWSEPGTYTIKVKLKDSYGTESNWSAPFFITIVQLKTAFFLGSFDSFNQTEDLFIMEGRAFIVFPSHPIFYKGETIVISKDYLGHLGTSFILGLGGVAIP
jgi:hypothetical protein